MIVFVDMVNATTVPNDINCSWNKNRKINVILNNIDNEKDEKEEGRNIEYEEYCIVCLI